MSKELKNITKVVMDRIHHDKIKMRPRVYFVFGSFLAFIGLVASIFVSIFLVGLIRFSLRVHGPIGEYRLEKMISDFPWWITAVAILGLVLGLWLLHRYDFSYKIKFKFIVAIFVIAVITAGWFVDMMGLNDSLLRQGPGRGIMKKYFQENNIPPGQGRGVWFDN